MSLPARRFDRFREPRIEARERGARVGAEIDADHAAIAFGEHAEVADGLRLGELAGAAGEGVGEGPRHGRVGPAFAHLATLEECMVD